MNLKNKVAIVTGAANGIGAAIAEILAKYNAKIILADIVEAVETRKHIFDLGGHAKCVVLDVTDRNSILNCIEECYMEYGKIDILANNAGIYNNGHCLTYTEEQWDKLMDIDLKGAFFMAQAVAKKMAENGGGRIINTSSQAGKSPEFSNIAYCIAKRGIVAMTQVMAMELAEYGINVNAICPGYTETPLLLESYDQKSKAYGKSIEDVKRDMFAEVPLKRPAKPEEIGELVAFLSDDVSAYITGESIIINGGKMME